MRIVSLLPSATEMVCALGLRDALVGVSHECDFPADVAGLPRVTRTRIDHHAPSAEIDRQVRSELAASQALYSLETERLAGLAPDVIVTQSLCDVCAVADDEVQTFARAHAPAARIVNIQPYTLADVLDTARAIAAAAEVDAAALVDGVRARLDAVRTRTAALPAATPRPRVAFLEWVDPLFCGGHWNPELVALAGGVDVFGTPGTASRTLPFEALAAADPDVVFLACCGFTLERSRAELAPLLDSPAWRALRAVASGNVWMTDGNAFFSRPGPRLADSAEILGHALHPDIHPAPAEPAVQP